MPNARSETKSLSVRPDKHLPATSSGVVLGISQGELGLHLSFAKCLPVALSRLAFNHQGIRRCWGNPAILEPGISFASSCTCLTLRAYVWSEENSHEGYRDDARGTELDHDLIDHQSDLSAVRRKHDGIPVLRQVPPKLAHGMGVGHAHNAQGQYVRPSERAGCARLIEGNICRIIMVLRSRLGLSPNNLMQYHTKTRPQAR